MIHSETNRTVTLTGNLLLNELSNKFFPGIASYQTIKTVDLRQLANIDSAGIAYLAQIKSNYAELGFVGVSDKILVLAHLYGLSFIFKSEGVQ